MTFPWLIDECWYFQGNISSDEFYARYSMISGTEDDGLSILSFCRLLVISLFWGDFVGAERHVWVGLVVCGELNKKMGVVDLRGKCNSPQVKIFHRGSCWGGRCLWKRECCKSGCNMMSVMLMWVLHAKSKLVLGSRSLISQ